MALSAILDDLSALYRHPKPVVEPELHVLWGGRPTWLKKRVGGYKFATGPRPKEAPWLALSWSPPLPPPRSP